RSNVRDRSAPIPRSRSTRVPAARTRRPTSSANERNAVRNATPYVVPGFSRTNDADFNWTGVSRRRLLQSLPALLMAPRIIAQTASSMLRVTGINHVTLSVSDVKRSVDFYQGLFGMLVVSRQGPTTNLRIGAGPQFLGISAAGSSPPRINHLCLGVEDFDVNRITGVLAARGITKSDSSADGGARSADAPLRMRVRVRGPEAGGDRAGTPELYFTDPD